VLAGLKPDAARFLLRARLSANIKFLVRARQFW
jgi:hypothetical protein